VIIIENNWIYVSRCNAMIRGATRAITCLLEYRRMNGSDLWYATIYNMQSIMCQFIGEIFNRFYNKCSVSCISIWFWYDSAI